MTRIMTWEFITENGNTPVIDNTVSYDGISSIKFTIPGTTNGISSGVLSSLDFESAPGLSYIFSGRIKAQGVLGTGAPIIRLAESDINGNWLRDTNLVFNKGTYDWTLKSRNVVTGANTAFIYIASNLRNSYGTFWIDDVNLSASGTICPALSASLQITPITISSSGSFSYISKATGGQYGTIGDDAFGHEILIDDVVVYNTGLGKDVIMTGSISVASLSTGTHSVRSRITDACLPVHQVAISPAVTLTVNLPSCIPTWQCEIPLNGYEHDTNNCGGPRRLNSACNPVTPPITDNTLIWFGVGAAVITTIAYLLRRKNDVKRD